MYKIYVIGISEPELSSDQQLLLETCSLLVATKRLMDIAVGFSGRLLPIAPLDTAIGEIRSTLQDGNVALFASGDPLFYGIGQKLLSEFPSSQVEIFPALSSTQRACALFKTPWNDAEIISFHGRDVGHIPGILLKNKKSIVFTDANCSPHFIAQNVLNYLQLIDLTELQDEIVLSIAENIGLRDEKITLACSLKEAAAMEFSSLNVLLIQVPESLTKFNKGIGFGFGLHENEISHSRGLITKSEVRAVTLHQLRLPKRGVMWDVGAGSGSISIESARSNPNLTIYAIEHKEEELENIKDNIRKFHCFNIIPVFGRAPEMLNSLPQPDRVFIGGSSGALGDIVKLIAKTMATDGILVINGVIEKTIISAPLFMREAGFSVHESVINVSRTSPNGESLNFNPITVMTGTR